jgi:hypothetical protein
MNPNEINKMLEDLLYYHNCDITYTYSKCQTPFSVRIKKEKNQNYFQITLIETQQVDLYIDLDSAVLSINKLLNDY